MTIAKEVARRTRVKKGLIKVCKNGPYIISGGIPLVELIVNIDAEGYPHGWRQGIKYPMKETYSLCRCGRSKGKPFCDGTHTGSNFMGSETARREPYLEQAERIDGPTLSLTDVPDLCAVAGFCERAGGIWDLARQSRKPTARKYAIEEAWDCPSGRLVVWEKETGNDIEPEFERSIGVTRDPRDNKPGPLWVRGGIPIESADGVIYEIRNRVTLCSCGKSRNKPFCDGSHP
jgi:CDGSH-type Zn-finger protein